MAAVVHFDLVCELVKAEAPPHEHAVLPVLGERLQRVTCCHAAACRCISRSAPRLACSAIEHAPNHCED